MHPEVLRGFWSILSLAGRIHARVSRAPITDRPTQQLHRRMFPKTDRLNLGGHTYHMRLRGGDHVCRGGTEYARRDRWGWGYRSVAKSRGHDLQRECCMRMLGEHEGWRISSGENNGSCSNRENTERMEKTSDNIGNRKTASKRFPD
ncbi:hypothetical protein BDU57DRAFT_122156 [Ampelomyces quisqualis]|uniref:Uncharacterized protein n=1 Tax=Ampelomyces quisqualis TaxID=50730 RepID=A0A6A5QWB7_AMPQU|nr:hypothetical protein BDU57DRAFT_122156 [Ampelomyces quisqualis]